MQTGLSRILKLAGALAGIAPWLPAAALEASPAATPAPRPVNACLPDGKGFFRARLQGVLDAELDWSNADTECTGATRPDGGVRLGFSRAIYADGQRLVVLFGIAGLKEGASAKVLPVNVTIIRQGTGQFFGTQGDGKCTLDDVQQVPIVGIPLRNRIYRVTGRGFCTQPARSLRGDGVVLMTRFDFSGRVDFSEADSAEDPAPLSTQTGARNR